MGFNLNDGGQAALFMRGNLKWKKVEFKGFFHPNLNNFYPGVKKG